MKTATLTYDEYPDESVEVVVSPVPMDAYWALHTQLMTLKWNKADFDALGKAFAPYLHGWTFKEKPDANGLAARDYNLALAIVRDWLTEVREAPLPLSRRSSASDRSAETDPPSSTEPSS